MKLLFLIFLFLNISCGSVNDNRNKEGDKVLKEESAPSIEWEVICKDPQPYWTYRVRVPNGWLVTIIPAVSGASDPAALTYIPDLNHEWKIEQ